MGVVTEMIQKFKAYERVMVAHWSHIRAATDGRGFFSKKITDTVVVNWIAFDITSYQRHCVPMTISKQMQKKLVVVTYVRI